MITEYFRLVWRNLLFSLIFGFLVVISLFLIPFPHLYNRLVASIGEGLLDAAKEEIQEMLEKRSER